MNKNLLILLLLLGSNVNAQTVNIGNQTSGATITGQQLSINNLPAWQQGVANSAMVSMAATEATLDNNDDENDNTSVTINNQNKINDAKLQFLQNHKNEIAQSVVDSIQPTQPIKTKKKKIKRGQVNIQAKHAFSNQISLYNTTTIDDIERKSYYIDMKKYENFPEKEVYDY